MLMTVILAAVLAPTPVPQAACVLERGQGGSVEFVCGSWPESAGQPRRVLVDGVDCGEISRRGDAMLWTGCERLERIMGARP
jgi:hypothetical protein